MVRPGATQDTPSCLLDKSTNRSSSQSYKVYEQESRIEVYTEGWLTTPTGENIQAPIPLFLVYLY